MAGTLCITVDSPRLILVATSSENRSIFRSCIFSSLHPVSYLSITSMDQIELGTTVVAFETDKGTTTIFNQKVKITPTRLLNR